MEKEIRGHTLEYWKDNAEEDYNLVPISVLKYITILEEQLEQVSKLPMHDVIKSYSEKNMDDAYDKGYNDGASAAANDIMNSL